MVKREFCPQGHEYTPENTAKNSRGHRYCRTCHRARNKGCTDPGCLIWGACRLEFGLAHRF